MANVSDAFVALADPTRRSIFERVARRPQSVGSITKRMDVSRPAVSQHLKVLKDAGLVTDRQEGTRRIYSLDLRGLTTMRSYLDKFWDQALAAFQLAVEAEEEGNE